MEHHHLHISVLSLELAASYLYECMVNSRPLGMPVGYRLPPRGRGHSTQPETTRARSEPTPSIYADVRAPLYDVIFFNVCI